MFIGGAGTCAGNAFAKYGGQHNDHEVLRPHCVALSVVTRLWAPAQWLEVFHPHLGESE